MPLTRIITDGLTDQNVTSSKIADLNVTSQKISPNLQISLVRVLETANVFSNAIGGNVNIDVSNNTVYYFSANSTANVTFNLRANATHSFNSSVGIGQTISLALAVNHGTQRHTANVFIDGQAQTMYFFANTRPTSVAITNQEINLFSYSVIRTGSNSYTVLAGNTLFGLG
jgi:hypothetical protein